MSKEEVEFFKAEIFSLKENHREHLHIDLESFKLLLKNETRLTITGFDEHRHRKMQESEERRRYREQLKLSGIFDDFEFSTFTSVPALETRLIPSSKSSTNFSKFRQTSDSADLILRVEDKIRKPWQQAHFEEIVPDDESSSDADEDKVGDPSSLIAHRFDPLTETEREAVRAALALPHNEDVITEKFNAPITRRLMSSLIDGRWLNDEVIYLYIINTFTFVRVLYPTMCAT